MAYLFDPTVLQSIIRGVLGLAEGESPKPVERGASPASIDDIVDRLRDKLSERYPGHIMAGSGWIFNNAGGAMGEMCVLHASLTEYIIVFGTPIGTEGYSGRFAADDYFYILDGEHWAYSEGEHERRVCRPGEMSHLPRGKTCGYRMPDRCYAVEYARGFIPQMLPFALADAFTSTLDPIPVLRTMRVYTKAVVGELLRGKI